MGFNAIRITCGASVPRQLDLLDELGLLVCEERFGARELADPSMEKRWYASVTSVSPAGIATTLRSCMWSLLNEVKGGRLFPSCGSVVPRSFESSIPAGVVLWGSGRFDKDPTIGSLSNPGGSAWEGGCARFARISAFPHSARDQSIECARPRQIWLSRETWLRRRLRDTKSPRYCFRSMELRRAGLSALSSPLRTTREGTCCRRRIVPKEVGYVSRGLAEI